MTEIGSVANAPTISHSGLSFANPAGRSGYFCAVGICLFEPVLYAFESFA